MPRKNDCVVLKIESITNEGSGVGHLDGMAVFVPMSAPGDLLRVRLVKVLSSYCYGVIEAVLEPSPDRVEPGCAAYRRCGGCALRHLSYAAELREKERWIFDAFQRLGGFPVPPLLPILPSPLQEGYRNKAQYPFGLVDGRICCGFFAPRSHRLIPIDACPLQPPVFAKIVRAVGAWAQEQRCSVYDESAGTGLLRHLYLRLAESTGQIMVCIVASDAVLPGEAEFCRAVRAVCPQVVSIQLNINRRRDNVILGQETRVLYGTPVIEDILCGVRVSLSPLSFYQVNRRGAELLYAQARRFAEPKPHETLLDLYCGAGTIGLSMADAVSRLIGVEIVAGAVENARENAAAAGISNAEFLCADAEEAAAQLASQALRPDIVILDPPRRGCSPDTLRAVVQMSPSRVVMVSCNPATAARDAAFLCKAGYSLQALRGVDMFPRTAHVETVCLMSRVEGK